MLAVIHSATIFGIHAVPVRVEVDIAGGLPGFATVGLPENSVREARVRVQAAVVNSGFSFPVGRITVNLAPANLRKDGTGFDLPIALGILAAAGVVAPEAIGQISVVGELSLSGDVRPVRGALAAAEIAKEMGAKILFVAAENGCEAALVPGIEVRTVASFRDLIDYLNTKEDTKAPVALAGESISATRCSLDLADVCGQHQARRALEIAAAGGHNLLFVGGPGSGKTMMVRRLPSILPALSYAEALEVTRVHSAAGFTMGSGLIRERPFRAPHHTTTRAGLVGGGSGIPRPGELSLASNGVLFLDEFPEFPRSVLEVLRQPLESGDITLSRAGGTLTYPAKIMLVAAMNPCPCGNLGSSRRACRCSPQEVARYKGRLSGPLLDRIDLHVEVPPVDLQALQSTSGGECSADVAKRIAAARERQAKRIPSGLPNARLTRTQLLSTAPPTDAAQALLFQVCNRFGLSARAHDRILRVGRTVADLDGMERIEASHIAEAAQYRGDEKLLLAA